MPAGIFVRREVKRLITGKPPRPEKVKKVQEIREKIRNSQAIIFTMFEGITSQDMMDLRSELRKTGGMEMKVYKNTLIRIAFEQEGYELPESALKFTTALIFAKEDPVQAAKFYMEMSKAYEALKPKLLFLEGKVYGPEKVEELAKMPSKEQMMGMVVGAFAAPMRGLVTVLSGPMRNLVNVIDAIRRKKEESGE